MTRSTLINVSFSASLLVGLAACSDGCCSPDRRVADPLMETQVLTVAELQAWAWPPGEDAWRALDDAQIVELEQLISLLVSEAESAHLSRAQRRAAAALAGLVGVELHRVVVATDARRGVELWVVTEPADDRRGRGVYLIRVGKIGSRRSEPELLIEAPHCRFDRHTGAIALKLFVEGDAGPPRALFMNSAHRYRHTDGSREMREPASANLADAAHNPDHPIARVTARLLEQRELAVIQLHGFGRSAAAGDPDVIVSAGVARPRRASAATLLRLRRALPEHPMAHFGVDTDRLGARTNVQGRSARATSRCFVHIELSEALRKRLLGDREVRRRFASAVFKLDPEELRGGCR